MLIHHKVEQNTDDWLNLRCGLLSCSNLGVVMANYGKAFGEPAKRLAIKLAVEQLTGKLCQSDYKNDHMDRGHEQEPIARMLYQEETFCDVEDGGFYQNGKMGCSPDGLIYDEGLIEIKSVVANVQYENIKHGGIKSASYRWQCYGNLKLSEREWLDFVTYSSDFPQGNQLYMHRIYPDKEIYNQIEERTSQFFELVEEVKENIIKHGEK